MVHVISESCLHTKVHYGVPQSFMLGSILFTLYILPLDTVIRKHSINFQCLADDMQLYPCMKLEDTHQLVKLQEFLKGIKT